MSIAYQRFPPLRYPCVQPLYHETYLQAQDRLIRLVDHYRRVDYAKPSVDDGPPKNVNNIRLKLKRLLIEGERLCRIERDNKFLLKHILSVMKGPAYVDHYHKKTLAVHSTSLNFPFRKLKNEQINRENKAMLARIIKTKTSYDHVQLELWYQGLIHSKRGRHYVHKLWNQMAPRRKVYITTGQFRSHGNEEIDFEALREKTEKTHQYCFPLKPDTSVHPLPVPFCSRPARGASPVDHERCFTPVLGYEPTPVHRHRYPPSKSAGYLPVHLTKTNRLRSEVTKKKIKFMKADPWHRPRRRSPSPPASIKEGLGSPPVIENKTTRLRSEMTMKKLGTLPSLKPDSKQGTPSPIPTITPSPPFTPLPPSPPPSPPQSPPPQTPSPAEVEAVPEHQPEENVNQSALLPCQSMFSAHNNNLNTGRILLDELSLEESESAVSQPLRGNIFFGLKPRQQIPHGIIFFGLKPKRDSATVGLNSKGNNSVSTIPEGNRSSLNVNSKGVNSAVNPTRKGENFTITLTTKGTNTVERPVPERNDSAVRVSHEGTQSSRSLSKENKSAVSATLKKNKSTVSRKRGKNSTLLSLPALKGQMPKVKQDKTTTRQPEGKPSQQTETIGPVLLPLTEQGAVKLRDSWKRTSNNPTKPRACSAVDTHSIPGAKDVKRSRQKGDKQVSGSNVVSKSAPGKTAKEQFSAEHLAGSKQSHCDSVRTKKCEAGVQNLTFKKKPSNSKNSRTVTDTSKNCETKCVSETAIRSPWYEREEERKDMGRMTDSKRSGGSASQTVGSSRARNKKRCDDVWRVPGGKADASESQTDGSKAGNTQQHIRKWRHSRDLVSAAGQKDGKTQNVADVSTVSYEPHSNDNSVVAMAGCTAGPKKKFMSTAAKGRPDLKENVVSAVAKRAPGPKTNPARITAPPHARSQAKTQRGQ